MTSEARLSSSNRLRHDVQFAGLVGVESLHFRERGSEKLPGHDVGDGRVEFGHGIGDANHAPRAGDSRRAGGEDQRVGTQGVQVRGQLQEIPNVLPGGMKTRAGKSRSIMAIGPCMKSAEENRSATT